MNKTFSKSTLLYLTPAAHKQAVRTAKKMGVSLNAYVRGLIDADIAARSAPTATITQKGEAKS